MSASESVQRVLPKTPDTHWLKNQCGSEKCRKIVRQFFANTKNPDNIEIDRYDPARSLDSFCRKKHENPQECRKLVLQFSRYFISRADLDRIVY
ncbi:MAG: hypothetical protein KR126chlam6_01474 [Candidatus Anoxychlamydiales bacterium]|nr:hypothetical protein [Candidatus Anoxychlamydiales bacterium]